MSTHLRIDELGVLAFEDIRALEPTHAQVRAVLDAERVRGSRTSPRRIATIAAAGAVLLAGTAVAIPQTRDTIFDAFGSLERFLTGGDPPGTPVPQTERPGELNWFAGAAPGSERIIASAGGTRLAAFRQAATGMACLSYGLAVEECRSDAEWIAQLEGSPVLLRGPVPEASDGKLPLIGIVADAVVSIELTYADGGRERLDGIRTGFVLLVDGDRNPLTLVAQDASGTTLATVNVSNRQWSFSP